MSNSRPLTAATCSSDWRSRGQAGDAPADDIADRGRDLPHCVALRRLAHEQLHELAHEERIALGASRAGWRPHRRGHPEPSRARIRRRRPARAARARAEHSRAGEPGRRSHPSPLRAVRPRVPVPSRRAWRRARSHTSRRSAATAATTRRPSAGRRGRRGPARWTATRSSTRVTVSNWRNRAASASSVSAAGRPSSGNSAARSDRSVSDGAAAPLASTGRNDCTHGHSGGAPSSSWQRPHATSPPRARTSATSSSTSRVLPIPAVPVITASRVRGACESRAKPSSCASSISRPTNGALATHRGRFVVILVVGVGRTSRDPLDGHRHDVPVRRDRDRGRESVAASGPARVTARCPARGRTRRASPRRPATRPPAARRGSRPASAGRDARSRSGSCATSRSSSATARPTSPVASQRVDEVFLGRGPHLFEPRHLGGRERLVGEVGECRPPPAAERLLELESGARRVGREQRLRLGALQLERDRVDRLRLAPQHVARRLRDEHRRLRPGDARRFQHLPQVGDVRLERRGGGRRRRVAPQFIDQAVERHHSIGVHDENCEHRALGAACRARPAGRCCQ